MRKLEHPGFVLGDTLTEEQLAFFKKNGFIKFRGFIDRETVQQFLQEVERIQQHLLVNKTEVINGIPLKFGRDTDENVFLQRIAFTSHYSKRLHGFLQDDRLKQLLRFLEPYEGRIGENEKDGLVLNHYINKEESNFSQLGWHTDSPRDLFLGLRRIQPMLNVGLHLDDCPYENGGLRILPGTHTQNIFRLLFRKKYFIDHRPDKAELGLDIEAGDLTVHDGRLWHRVQQSPFTGEKSRRRVMYIPFVTGSYRPKHKDSPTPFYHRLALKVLNKYKIRPDNAQLQQLKPQLEEAAA